MLRRVAVIFDDQLRPETTGVYCRHALQQMVEVKHARPSEAHQLEPREFDLFLRIDDGLDYRLLTELRPSAWWAIDTHLDFERCLAQARDFDLVFAAQKDGAERLRNAGIGSATWLPLACDPEIHRTHDVEKQFDVSFVGNEFPGPRSDLLRLIQRKFLKTFIGQRYMDKMARTYSASRVVFNRSVKNDINMRVFEALACGSLLITNDLADNGQAELFKSGVHLETYRDADELIDKIKYYLGHDEARERIAAAGRAEVVAKHTYRQRMETILQRCREARVERRELIGRHLRDERRAAAETGNVRARADQPDHSGPRPSALVPPPATGSRPSTLSPQPFRDRSYFDHVRPELLALVPETARRVLDIGCAAGRLGEAIKARQTAEVTGIELDETAAAEARGRLDQVVVGNVETIAPPFDPGSFDCVVCGDILEHLEDTERVLARARSWLRSGGLLVASIPNVRHHSVLRSLLDGNWTYEPAGLLDRDHVRFFTRREIEKTLSESGFKIDRMQFVPGPGYDDWVGQGRPGTVRVGRLHVGGLSPEDAEEFFVYQFLVVASPVQNGSETGVVRDETSARRSPESSAIGPCNSIPSSNRMDADACNAVADVATPQRLDGSTARRMRFTQNFITDFDQFDFRGEPFAFVRFGDGERAICERRPIKAQDGWGYDGQHTQFSDDLNASLQFNDPNYYIGISDACCDAASKEWFLRQIRAPLDQVTFANIFVNWNYRRFRQLDLSGTFIVASVGGDLTVPDDLVTGKYDLDAIVEQLLRVDRPMLLAAGPASCIIAHKYWLRADPRKRQTIVDVGSAIDERTKGARTRQYQIAGTRTGELICTW